MRGAQRPEQLHSGCDQLLAIKFGVRFSIVALSVGICPVWMLSRKYGKYVYGHYDQAV